MIHYTCVNIRAGWGLLRRGPAHSNIYTCIVHHACAGPFWRMRQSILANAPVLFIECAYLFWRMFYFIQCFYIIVIIIILLLDSLSTQLAKVIWLFYLRSDFSQLHMAAARLLGTTKQSHADMGRPDNVSLKSRSNYLSYNFFQKSFERNV